MQDYTGEKAEKDFTNTIRKIKNMLKPELKNEIRNFLEKYIVENKFTDDTNIFTEGFVNSLFAMDLIVFIEKNYEFKIANEDLKIDNFKSVNSIAQLIQTKSNN